jgi:hypothetical protein
MGFMLHPEDALAPPGALLRQVPAYPSEPEVLKGFWPPKDARHGRPRRTSLPRHRTIKEQSARAAFSSSVCVSGPMYSDPDEWALPHPGSPIRASPDRCLLAVRTGKVASFRKMQLNEKFQGIVY